MAARKNNTSAVTIDLNEQAKEILKKAEEKGAEHSFVFITAFRRYNEQIKQLADLRKIIEEEGLIVRKEYVKGRENIYMNPAVNAYNATCAGADRTAQLLMRYILQPLSDGDDKDAFDLF